VRIRDYLMALRKYCLNKEILFRKTAIYIFSENREIREI